MGTLGLQIGWCGVRVMRGARFLSAVVLSALLGMCAGRDVLVVAAAAESSGDWKITDKNGCNHGLARFDRAPSQQ